MKNYISFFLLISTLLSCSTKSEVEKLPDGIVKIEIEEDNSIQEYNINEFVSTISFLVLDSDNSLISSIEDIRVVNDKAFIHDKMKARILIYDWYSGKLKDIIQQQGQGPNEYGDISFFDVDQTNNSVVIYDIRMGKIFRYDFQGRSVETIEARIICRDFGVTANGNFLFYSPDETNTFDNNQILNPGVIFMDKAGKQAKNILPLGKEFYRPLLGYGKSLIGNQNNFHLFSNYTDTIYTIHEDKVESKIFLDYQNKRLGEEPFINASFDYSAINYPMLKLKPFMSDKYISYSFFHKNKVKSLFYHREDKKSVVYELLANKLNHTPFVLNGKMTRDGRNYICIIDEMLIETFKELLKSEKINTKGKSIMKEIISTYQISQNPILAVGKLL